MHNQDINIQIHLEKCDIYLKSQLRLFDKSIKRVASTPRNYIRKYGFSHLYYLILPPFLNSIRCIVFLHEY
jgi:hypothetical protein